MTLSLSGVEYLFKRLDQDLESARLHLEGLEAFVDPGRLGAMKRHLADAHRHASMAHTAWLRKPKQDHSI